VQEKLAIFNYKNSPKQALQKGGFFLYAPPYIKTSKNETKINIFSKPAKYPAMKLTLIVCVCVAAVAAHSDHLHLLENTLKDGVKIAKAVKAGNYEEAVHDGIKFAKDGQEVAAEVQAMRSTTPAND